jgi:hypothetical protein
MEEAMSSQRERAAWTEYAEIRQRQQNQTPRKPRARKPREGVSTPEEREAALDDLTRATEDRTPRSSS